MSQNGPPIDRTKWLWRREWVYWATGYPPLTREICSSMATGLFIIQIDATASGQQIDISVSQGNL